MTSPREHSTLTKIFAQAIESADTLIVVTTKDFAIEYANTAFCQLIETEASQLCATNLTNTLTSFTPAIEINTISTDLEKSGKWQGELRWTPANGHVTYYHACVTKIEEDSLYWSFTDVTAQKERDLKHAITENRLNSLLEHMPAYIYTKDKTGRYTYANTMLQKLLAFKSDHIIGKTDFDLFHQNGAEVFTRNDQNVLRTGKAQHSLEETGVDEFGIERSYLSVKCPVRDASGDIVEVLGMSIDISEQQRLAKTLREKQEKLDSILNNMKSRVFVKDQNFEYTYVNEEMCRRHKMDSSTIMGKNDFDLFDFESAIFFRSTDEEVLKTRQKVERVQAVKNLKSKQTRYFHIIKVPLLNAEGEAHSILGISTDVTEQRQLEEALRKNENKLSTILENIKAHVYMKDVNSIYTYVNKDLCQYLNRSKDEILGKTDEELFGPKAARRFRQNDVKVFNYRDNVTCVEKSRHGKTDKRHYFLSVKVPLMNDWGNPEALLGISTDITEQKRLEKELREMASTDVLTGVFNRRHFIDLCEREIIRAERYNTDLSLVMLDIDHFKTINDTFGHAIGDDAIRATTEICRQNLRLTDSIARIGGEEFAILLPQTNLEGAALIAERIRVDIENFVLPTGEEDVSHQFTSSFGITALHHDDAQFDDLLKRADIALYESKSKGRNRVSLG